MTATQTQAVLRDARLCALVHVSQARMFLGVDEYEVVARVEEGFLLGFNIALDARDSRRELRILWESIEFCLRGWKKHSYWNTWKHIVLRGLSADKPVRAPEVKHILNCKHTHVTELIDAGELHQVKGTEYGVGRGNEALVTRESLVGFLERRSQ